MGKFGLKASQLMGGGNELLEKVYNTVLLGALLHDIGKMLQRGDFGALNFKGKHPELSGQFIAMWGNFLSAWADLELLESIVTRHHESSVFPVHLRAQNAPIEFRNMCLLVSRADNYSAAERDDPKGSGYFRTKAQSSVFSSIKLKSETIPVPSYYKPVEYSVNNIFPQAEEKLNPGELTVLVKNFGTRMKEISEVNWPSFQTLFCHLLACLEQFSWCLPASTQEALPDVSLYDHLRTTAAIAGAMFKYHESIDDFSQNEILNDKTDKFLLLAGDLTGIQQYIYGIANIGAGGVAKRLRARSFYLTLITAGLVHKIVHDLDLTPANIISHSGGNFYLLLPNTQETVSYLQVLKATIAEEFLHNYNGELFLNLSAIPFCGGDLKNYGQVLSRAGEILSHAKLNPLSEILFQPDGYWREDAFVLEKTTSQESGYCRSCGKLPVTVMWGEEKLCNLCMQDINMGTVLPAARSVVFYLAQPKEGNSFRLPGGIWAMLSKKIPEITDEVLAVYVNSEESMDDYIMFPARRVFWGSYVPASNGNVLDFDSLAGLSTGKKMLGIVKTDVDDLGALFNIGLADRGTISRIATLSRMLESFFSGWLTSLIREKFQHVYLVYSGGDDLLAIGPWNEMIEFAVEVRESFKRFAGCNPDVNLSTGIAIVKPAYPIALGVEMAERHLESAKQKAQKRDSEGKNQCSLLGETVSWNDLRVLVSQGKSLADWLNLNLVPSQFVQALLLYAGLYDRFKLHGEIEGLKYLPLLNYNVQRNIKRNNSTEKVYKWVQELTNIESLSIQHLGVTARYALMARRESSAR